MKVQHYKTNRTSPAYYDFKLVEEISGTICFQEQVNKNVSDRLFAILSHNIFLRRHYVVGEEFSCITVNLAKKFSCERKIKP